MKAHTTQGESEAMQIGRDDYKAYGHASECCPFPQGSEDAREWQEGWEKEKDGK